MTSPCVVICSEPRVQKIDQSQDIQTAITQLVNMFGKFTSNRIEGFDIDNWPSQHVDGGNSGGGDGARAPIFIRGEFETGLWNFRACRARDQINDFNSNKRFPAAGRVELCFVLDSIEKARNALSRGETLYFLRSLFTNIVIAPLSSAAGLEDVKPFQGGSA